MKKVYKSSLYIIIKNIVYGICGGGVAALIIHIWLDLIPSIVVGTSIGLFIIYLAVYADNIKLIIENEKLSIYRFSKLKHEFNLSEVSISASIKTTYDGAGSDSDCYLTITKSENKVERIDCSMLGVRRFYRMLDDLDINNGEPVKIKTKKKEK